MSSDVKQTIRTRALLGWGKIRRFYYGFFRKGYVEQSHRNRSGDCIRCGACCKLMFDCPFLKVGEDGLTACACHDKRPKNCRIFPVDRADLRDRDLISPNKSCGFTFSDD